MSFPCRDGRRRIASREVIRRLFQFDDKPPKTRLPSSPVSPVTSEAAKPPMHEPRAAPGVLCSRVVGVGL